MIFWQDNPKTLLYQLVIMRKCHVWDFIYQTVYDFITENGAKMTIYRVFRILPLFGAIRNHLKEEWRHFSNAHLKLFRVLSYKYSNLWLFFIQSHFQILQGQKQPFVDLLLYLKIVEHTWYPCVDLSWDRPEISLTDWLFAFLRSVKFCDFI